MHDLNEQIARWRKTVTREVGPEALRELEAHLREATVQLMESGLTEADAFTKAVEELGSTQTIAAEFRKLAQPGWWPLRIVITLVIMTPVALALVMAHQFSRLEPLLWAYGLAFDWGYFSTLWLGVLGACFLGQRCFTQFSSLRLARLARTTFKLGAWAFALTALGLGLGAWWEHQEQGRYWTWDARQAIACVTLIWQAIFLVVHWRCRGEPRVMAAWSLCGNIVVSCVWLGAGSHSWGILGGVVVGHLAFLLLGRAPAGCLRLRKA